MLDIVTITIILFAVTVVFGLWTMFRLAHRHGMVYTWGQMSVSDRVMFCVTIALVLAFLAFLVSSAIINGGPTE